jgi:hypothetical protein
MAVRKNNRAAIFFAFIKTKLIILTHYVLELCKFIAA